MVNSISAQTQVYPQTVGNNYQQQIPPSKIKDLGTHYEVTYETEGSTGKKWGVGIASACIPGLGQAINGEWGKGLAFFGGSIGAKILGGIFRSPAMTMIGGLGVRIWSVVDAVKNAKGEIKTLVPKEQANFDTKG